MAHLATKRYSYWSQLAILLGLLCAGFLASQVITAIALSNYIKFGVSEKELMSKLLVPENANLLRILQFISVLFMFFIPTLLYAKICHWKSFNHVGFKKELPLLPLLLAILIIFSAMPLVGAMRDLTMHLPLNNWIKGKIIDSKENYFKEVVVIGRMNSFGEYLLSLFVIAVLPGLFEELFFRGGLQNLFTRWFKNPVAAILLSAFIFSAFHFEFSDFLGRFLLGIVLGWVFYQTGNLWINVIMHAAFNGFSVTGLYMIARAHEKIDASKLDDSFSLPQVFVTLLAMGLLIYYFHKQMSVRHTEPGKEIIMKGYEDYSNPFATTAPAIVEENKLENE